MNLVSDTQDKNTLMRAVMIGMLVVSLILGSVSFAVLVKAGMEISNSNTLINGIERVVSSLKDVESGYRGFVIVGREDYLDPYDEGIKDVAAEMQQVREAASNDNAFAARMPLFERAIEAKLAWAADIVRRYQQESVVSARSQFDTGGGKARMDVVRAQAKDLQALAIQESARLYNWRVWPAALGFLLSLVFAGITTFYFITIAGRARRASARTSQLMVDVIGRAPVGVALVDHTGRLSQANASFREFAGITTGSGAGRFLSDLAPEMHGALAKPIAVAASGFRATWKSQPSTPLDVVRGNRTTHLVASLFPVELGTGEWHDKRGVGIVLNDVTRQRSWEMELERARDEAESANRAKSAFIANMSHELRTPLTAVLGYSELLEEEIRDLGEDELLSDLNKIALNAKHLMGLINDVLDLSKIEAHRMDVSAVEFDVSKMLEEVQAAADGLMDKNDNRFVIVSDLAPGTMVSDDLKIKQILLNLIGNAAKFTSSGTIKLRVESVGNDMSKRVRFTVADTGIGMSEEQLAKLFERFRQADDTTTRKYGGTGLGLALTRGLVVLLHGDIAVNSVTGEGTTFVVELPLVHKISDAGDVGASGNETETTGAILVVDDDASVRDVVERILTREGFKVITAADGQQALEKARTLRPSAILLDVMLPVMDGWNVLKALRADRDTADIPVIMQTLLDEETFAYAHGANGYLKKPIRRTRLIEALALASNATDRLVMVIDDDPAARSRLSRVLRRSDWHVVEKSNGREALEALETLTPNLILVDLVMPEMDGHAFIRHLRQNELWAAIPVIVLTAEDIDAADVKELENFAAEIIQKGSMPLTALVANLRQYTHEPVTDHEAGTSHAETSHE